MARATVDVSLRADIKDLVSNLEKVQGVTKKEAKAMVREMKKGYDQQIKASKIAADAQIKNAKKSGKFSADEASKLTDVFQKSATEISSIFGVGVLGDLEGLFDISKQSAEKFGMSAVTAFTAVGVAGVIAVTAISAYVAKQRELTASILQTLEANAQFLAPKQLTALQELEQTVKDIDTAYERLALDGLAKSIDHTERMLLAALAFRAIGLPQFLADTLAFITKAVDAAGKQMAESFELVSAGMSGTQADLEDVRGTFSGMGQDIADAATEINDASRRAKDGNAEWLASMQKLSDEEKKIASPGAAAATEEKAVAAKRLATATRLSADMQSQLNAEIAEEERLGAQAFKALGAADQVREKAEARQLDARGKLNAAYIKEIAIIQRASDLNGENAISTEAMAQAMAAYNKQLDDLKKKETAEDMAKMASDVGLAASAINELAGAASTFAGLALDKFSELANAEAERFATLQEQKGEAKRQEIADLLEAGEITQLVADARLKSLERNEQIRAENHNNLNKDQRKQAKTAFAVSQSAAVASVLADSAAAYMAYLIAFAWAGFGGPALAAALVGTATAAQLAVVASNKPPQFADGGLIGARTTPDHMLIAAQRGEGVVSRRGVAALGGASGLDALNKGGAGGGNVTANIVLDRRIIGQAVADLVDNSIARRTGRLAVYGR